MERAMGDKGKELAEKDRTEHQKVRVLTCQLPHQWTWLCLCLII
jgi:hypothetical protein